MEKENNSKIYGGSLKKMMALQGLGLILCLSIPMYHIYVGDFIAGFSIGFMTLPLAIVSGIIIYCDYVQLKNLKKWG